MNLQNITPETPIFYGRCKDCGQKYSNLLLYADLDDEPETYYCGECVSRFAEFSRKLKVEITGDNLAFDYGNARREFARILRDAADRVQADECTESGGGELFDSDGHIVGRLRLLVKLS